MASTHWKKEESHAVVDLRLR